MTTTAPATLPVLPSISKVSIPDVSTPVKPVAKSRPATATTVEEERSDIDIGDLDEEEVDLDEEEYEADSVMDGSEIQEVEESEPPRSRAFRTGDSPPRKGKNTSRELSRSTRPDPSPAFFDSYLKQIMRDPKMAKVALDRAAADLKPPEPKKVEYTEEQKVEIIKLVAEIESKFTDPILLDLIRQKNDILNHEKLSSSSPSFLTSYLVNINAAIRNGYKTRPAKMVLGAVAPMLETAAMSWDFFNSKADITGIADDLEKDHDVDLAARELDVWIRSWVPGGPFGSLALAMVALMWNKNRDNKTDDYTLWFFTEHKHFPPNVVLQPGETPAQYLAKLHDRCKKREEKKKAIKQLRDNSLLKHNEEIAARAAAKAETTEAPKQYGVIGASAPSAVKASVPGKGIHRVPRSHAHIEEETKEAPPAFTRESSSTLLITPTSHSRSSSDSEVVKPPISADSVLSKYGFGALISPSAVEEESGSDEEEDSHTLKEWSLNNN
jgi:hypothetical protein